jgi:tRNA modification GTPase
MREASNAIEAEGVRRAEQRAQDAALRLVVLDATDSTLPEKVRALITDECIVVVNKADLLNGKYTGPELPDEIVPILVSAETGAGLEDLLARLTGHIRDRLETFEAPLPTRQRHRDALAEANAALANVADAAYPELAAEDVRVALRVDIDEILDTVFRDFCIGK